VRALVGGGDKLESEGGVAGVCPVQAAFDTRAFDFAGEHDDDVYVLFPAESANK
jgi:hypothetical protein